jgi:hypothetical protein
MDFEKYLNETRPKDASGQKIYGMDEYVLIVKSGSKRGRYVGALGAFPGSNTLEKDDGSARVFMGRELMSMAYDWQMGYVAQKIKI